MQLPTAREDAHALIGRVMHLGDLRETALATIALAILDLADAYRERTEFLRHQGRSP